MPYLVDGHNLIPKVPGLSLSSIDDEQHLIDWLKIFCQRSQKDVEVFFDQAPPGYPSKRNYGRVIAHFVRKGTTADQAIQARLLTLAKTARNYIVVSSDRQVQAAARAARALVQSSEEFVRELLRPSGGGTAGGGDITSGDDPARGEISPADVAEWEEIFRKGKKGKSP